MKLFFLNLGGVRVPSAICFVNQSLSVVFVHVAATGYVKIGQVDLDRVIVRIHRSSWNETKVVLFSPFFCPLTLTSCRLLKSIGKTKYGPKRRAADICINGMIFWCIV